ncbi:hypothetical protein HK096_003016, partial [Nowakowskiella sp. JEL0078]
MVKSYLKYEKTAPFNVILSNNSNILYWLDPIDNSHLAVVPALSTVNIWNIHNGTLVTTWSDVDCISEVTCICKSQLKDASFAVGYSDGSIRIWSLESSTPSIIFNGHRSAVTALAFDKHGSRLASGSKDTDLLVWDVVSERGLFRLRGHKDMISGLAFLSTEGKNHIVSISKDTLMKVWDLSTQHCVETIIAHRNELCALAITSDETTLFTGGVDQEIKVWKVDMTVLCSLLEPVKPFDPNAMDVDEAAPELGINRAITHYGSLNRTGNERVLTLTIDKSSRYLGVHGADKSVELFVVRTKEEIKKKRARQRKRKEEKLKKSVDFDSKIDIEVGEPIKITEEISQIHSLRCSGKVRSIAFSTADLPKDDSFHLLCGLSSNQLEFHQVIPNAKEEKNKLVSVLDIHGHRSDVRTLSLSSDDQLILSASNDSVKLWDVRTRQCIKTMESDYALCSTFVPGNQYAIVGTKTGLLELYDLTSSTLLKSYEVHTGPIWSLQVQPDNTGIVTGSADKEVKFFDFHVDQTKGAPILHLVHTRTLRMTDDILCVRFTPDSRLLAVSLLDSTVKLFFVDTLKFYISLYGHKLPVLSMDISSDSTLLVTGSADKTIKIWGLEFGDCHKSLIAHEDSVMTCQFVWGTHYIFSAGKDNLIKYWDADKFEMIMKLEGHLGEVWCLTVGKYGNMVVSASHDRSIRIWDKTDEQLFLEEEREREREELFEMGALKNDEKHSLPIGALADGDEYDNIENGQEVGEVGKKSMDTLKAAEKIYEALEIWEEENLKAEEHSLLLKINPNAKPPVRNLHLVATGDESMTAEGYVLRVIERIRSTELEQALLVLEFSKVKILFMCIDIWADKGWNPPLTCRVLMYLLKQHQPQIVATRSLRPILVKLQSTVTANIQKYRDSIGFNIAALKYLKREWDAEHSAEFVNELDESAKGKSDKSKKKMLKRKVVV